MKRARSLLSTELQQPMGMQIREQEGAEQPSLLEIQELEPRLNPDGWPPPPPGGQVGWGC